MMSLASIGFPRLIKVSMIEEVEILFLALKFRKQHA